MNLLKYIQNRNKVKKDLPCLKTLGNKTAVASFGRFWENNGDDLMTVVAGKLLQYSEQNNYTREEFAAYKEGVGVLSKFFAECWAEKEEQEKDH
ncbi:hypothetical protein KBA63_00090 [Candidatus Woesebacteria bacterium]|nr:hypothetical protein [Candidatus Woesebacteria bacterium]